MVRYSWIIIAVLLLVAGMTGCSGGKWSRYELYMGQTFNDGKDSVGAQQWEDFLKTEVTPKFSDGYTVLEAQGFWGSKGVTYAEKSKVLMVVSPDGDAEEYIDEVADAYKKKFNQEAVLKLTYPVDIEFR